MRRGEAGGQLAPRLQVLTHLFGLGVVLLQRLGQVRRLVHDEQPGVQVVQQRA